MKRTIGFALIFISSGLALLSGLGFIRAGWLAAAFFGALICVGIALVECSDRSEGGAA